MKNTLFITLSILVLVGSGCFTETNSELETLERENEDIENMALIDAGCDAWMEDENIAIYSDRKVFADLCYFSKSIEQKDARYCLSASTKIKNDCVEVIAVKFNEVNNCLNYLPDTLKVAQMTCIMKVAAVSKNADVCQNVASDFSARCTDIVEQCITNPKAAITSCSPEIPQTISCDYLYETTDRSRCEAEFYETFISL